MFIAVNVVLRTILVDDTTSYTRIMMHQLYEQEDQIDLLVVGSSHAYRSFVPAVMDEELGIHTFNAGSSSQGLDGSYAVIKEAYRHHNPQSIYLELYYGIAEAEEYEERTQMTATYILSDYMKPSVNKYRFLLSASDPELYIDGFIPARRNWRALFDIDYIKELAEKKRTGEYKQYKWTGSGSQNEEYYVDRGYVANDATAAPDIQETAEIIPIKKANQISAANDWYISLTEIISYCKSKDIPLTLVIAPQTTWSIDALGQEYLEYSNRVYSISKEYDLDFMDFNLCKPELFDRSKDEYFKDADHLNNEGAEAFTRAFCRCVTEREMIKTMFEKPET